MTHPHDDPARATGDSASAPSPLSRLVRQNLWYGLMLGLFYATWAVHSDLRGDVYVSSRGLTVAIAFGVVLAFLAAVATIALAGGARPYRRLDPAARARVDRALATGVPEGDDEERDIEWQLAKSLMPAGRVGQAVGTVAVVAANAWLLLSVDPRPPWWIVWVAVATIAEIATVALWARGDRRPLERLQAAIEGRAVEHQP